MKRDLMNRTGCGAAIRWVTTAKNGKRVPLDAEPTPLGNVVMRNYPVAYGCPPGASAAMR